MPLLSFWLPSPSGVSMTGKPKIAITLILAAFSIWCIYVTLFATFLEEIRLTSFMALIILMGFLIYPDRKDQIRPNYIPIYDIIFMIAGSGAFLYYTFNANQIINQGTRFEWYQIIIGIIGILALVEITRRCVGIPILCVAGFFLIYALSYGLTNPAFFGRVKYLVRNLFYTKEGILATPVNVCSKYIVVFIIFGAFLERSSVGNTVTTGSVTIPMMKKTGYQNEFAGAVEAASSTGGQIMPPIMGAAAFLMADFIGVPYADVIKRAVLPAVLYFFGIFITVHLEAKRLDLHGVPKEELPKMSRLIRKIYLLIPLVALIFWVSTNAMTMQRAASLAIVLSIVVGFINRDAHLTPGKILDALSAGGRSAITVGAACGVAGIISGTITMTGLANELINAIVGVAGDQRHCRRSRRQADHRPGADHALLYRPGHGRSHNGQLLYHGGHHSPDPDPYGRSDHGGPFLRILLWYRCGYYPAGRPGRLRGFRHCQE